MEEKKSFIPCRLKNAAVGGHVAGTEDIYDDILGRTQNEINSDTYRKDETYSKIQLNSLITTPEVSFVSVDAYNELPEQGSSDTIYRVANYDGIQVVSNKYCEYAWDDSNYVLLAIKDYGFDTEPTAGSTNWVTSGGVFDFVPSLDNTLSRAGCSADAGVVGEHLYKYVDTVFNKDSGIVWEQGTINNLGQEQSSYSLVRTKEKYHFSESMCLLMVL